MIIRPRSSFHRRKSPGPKSRNKLLSNRKKRNLLNQRKFRWESKMKICQSRSQKMSTDFWTKEKQPPPSTRLSMFSSNLKFFESIHKLSFFINYLLHHCFQHKHYTTPSVHKFFLNYQFLFGNTKLCDLYFPKLYSSLWNFSY